MNFKINGFRAGIIASMLAVTGVGCKRVPYKPMPKEFVSPKTEIVLDSFCKQGDKVRNNPDYKLIKQDTIRLYDTYIENPEKLEQHLKYQCYEYNHVTDENGVDWDVNCYKDPQLIISDSHVYTNDGKKQFIAVEEYAKK